MKTVNVNGYTLKYWYQGVMTYCVLDSDGAEVLYCWNYDSVIRFFGFDPLEV